MVTSGSYNVRSSHRDLDSEIERLRIQTLSSWKKELRNLVGFGLRDGMSVLELGSGPGFVTKQLLGEFPATHVTAVEIDPTLAERAAAYLNIGASRRARIVNASVADTGLAENTFDFAVARLVFQHLPDPDAAAREIRRVLKPGGKLVITDSDDAVWGLTEPEIPEMALVVKAHGRAQSLQGGNGLAGRGLWRILDRAGFIDLALEAVVIHSDESGLGTLMAQLDPGRLLPLVQAGLLSEADVERFSASHRTLSTAQDAIVIMFLLMACGVKPAR